MKYFFTGATGFIGKRLVKKLLENKESVVYFLTRKQSEEKIPALLQYWESNAQHVIPIYGDIRDEKDMSVHQQ